MSGLRPTDLPSVTAIGLLFFTAVSIHITRTLMMTTCTVGSGRTRTSRRGIDLRAFMDSLYAIHDDPVALLDTRFDNDIRPDRLAELNLHLEGTELGCFDGICAFACRIRIFLACGISRAGFENGVFGKIKEVFTHLFDHRPAWYDDLGSGILVVHPDHAAHPGTQQELRIGKGQTDVDGARLRIHGAIDDCNLP